MSAEPVPEQTHHATSATAAVLREAVDRCVGSLVDARPARQVRVALYDGDAGTAVALARLAVATGRSDCMRAAQLHAAAALGRLDRLTSAGLLHGTAGVLAAAAVVEQLSGERLTTYRRPAPPAAPAGTGAELATGVAGVLLGQLASGAGHEAVTESVRALARMARAADDGFCWASGPLATGHRGAALCGMAHGASGITVALAEAAACHPAVARPATALAVEAVQWESARYDRRRAGWPDQRDRPPTFPSDWCNGAAGVGAARLRLLQLARAGIGLDVAALEVDTLRAVRCGMATVGGLERGGWSGRSVALAGGLGLCHGLGGVLDTLALATEVWEDPHYLQVAQRCALVLVAERDDDPRAWPGIPADPLSGSLYLGLAGTALVLARLAYPEAGIRPPSLPV
jgi:lantibiotic modifying enzyme